MLKRLESIREWPLWFGAFRPFFLLTAASAVIYSLAWWGALRFGWSFPGSGSHPIAWHGHEMLHAVVMASLVGFLLTALPEFTQTPSAGPRTYMALVLTWLAGRLAVMASASWAVFALDMAIPLWLIGFTWFRVHHSGWGREQRGFLWALMAIAVVIAGYHLAQLGGDDVMRWLRAQVGVWMILIVLAMSRISMRIVNTNLQAIAATDRVYLARPPRRNLAVLAIGLYTAAEWAELPHSVLGWLAAASMAALLNLTNDWHLGRVLFRRWVSILYLVYWCMAGGYGVMAAAWLADLSLLSGGRHLLMMGAMGLSIISVLSIAGRSHAGLNLDPRLWMPLACGLVVAGALLRVGWPWLFDSPWVLMAAIGSWVSAWLIYLATFTRVLIGPRVDGRRDASGPA